MASRQRDEAHALDAERFRALAAGALDRILELSPDGKIVYASPNHGSTVGFEATKLLGLSVEEFVHSEDRAVLAGFFQEAFGAEQATRAIYRARDPEGGWRWVEASLTPFRLADGTLRALLIARDVSERKDVEDRLAESERRLRVTMDHAFDVISVYSLDEGLLYANPRAREAFGWAYDPSTTEDPASIVHPEDRGRVIAAMANARPDGGPIVLKHRVRRGGGGWAWIESTSTLYVTERGDRRLVTIARDVSIQEEAAARLRESEERYRQLFESSPEAIVVLEGADVRFVNPAALVLFDVPDADALVGTDVSSWLEHHSGARVAIDELLGPGATSPQAGDLLLRRRDGAVRDVIVSGVGVNPSANAQSGVRQIVLRDVTALRTADREQARLRDELQEARRLESLGVLAGGVAHDFNNLLQVILSNARLAHEDISELAAAGADAELPAMLSDVVEAAESAARLTRQLLDYVGRGEHDTRPIDLSENVRALLGLFEAAAPKSVSLRVDLAPSIGSVMADAAQLEQVLLNLVGNAADALDGAPGEIAIETGWRDVTARDIAGWIGAPSLPPGRYARLTVSDDGCGMDAPTLARIFDPFFTTKVAGHGLGLSAVLGLVRAQGGGLAVDSAPGTGTTFTIWLPLIETEVEAPPPAPEPVEAIGATILIVDDEPAIRRLAQRILHRAACQTLEAVDGEDAITKFEAHADAIDLVLLDLSMPRRGGLDVLALLQAMRPSLPVLLASGYDEGGAARALAQQANVDFIDKPYREGSLVAAIRTLLEASGDPSVKVAPHPLPEHAGR